MGARSLGRFAKRTTQLAKVGLAARKLRKAPDPTQRAIARRALASVLADARGIPMKIGQLMAANSDPDHAFESLITSIDPLPVGEMKEELEAAWGKPIEQVLSHFEASRAAASLGQVHQAKLLNGQSVAIKIRYPDIADAVASEIMLAGLMPGMGPMKKWGFDLDGYKKLIHDNMERELNYLDESSRQTKYRQQVVVRGFRVPEVVESLCTENVLVQSFERGWRLESAQGWPPTVRGSIAQVLVEVLFKSLFSVGEVHSDPHPGNVFFRQRSPYVIQLDYGCTVPIERTRRLALLHLIIACRENRPVESLACYHAMGFDLKKLEPIANSLPAITRVLFRPFYKNNRHFDPMTWNVSQDLEKILGEHRWWFRSAGPPDSVLLLRAFQGLANQLIAIEAKIDWWEMLERAVGHQAMDDARNFRPPDVPTPRGISNWPQSATHLRVQVQENGVQRVSLAMPAEAALTLSNIIPPELLPDIQAAGISVEEVETRLLKTALQPQTVVELSIRGKSYRVWLE